MSIYGPRKSSGAWGRRNASNADSTADEQGRVAIPYVAEADGEYLVMVRNARFRNGGSFAVSQECTGGSCQAGGDPDEVVACNLVCPDGYATDLDGNKLCVCAGASSSCPDVEPSGEFARSS